MKKMIYPFIKKTLVSTFLLTLSFSSLMASNPFNDETPQGGKRIRQKEEEENTNSPGASHNVIPQPLPNAFDLSTISSNIFCKLPKEVLASIPFPPYSILVSKWMYMNPDLRFEGVNLTLE